MKIIEIISQHTDEDGNIDWEKIRKLVCPAHRLPHQLYKNYDDKGIFVTIGYLNEHIFPFYFEIFSNGTKHTYHNIPNLFETRELAENKAFVLAEMMVRNEEYYASFPIGEEYLKLINSNYYKLGQANSQLETALERVLELEILIADRPAFPALERMVRIALQSIRGKHEEKIGDNNV